MCRRLAFSFLAVSLLAVANSLGAGMVVMQCDVGGCGPLQPGWIGLSNCGTYTNVGGSGIDVTLATGEPGACACRDPEGTGPLADVEWDLLFANDQTTSPQSDFIITLSNLAPGVAYRLLSYHNRSNEGDTTIPNVTITGATVISKPASIVQNHDIMDDPAECVFVAGAGDAVIRYQGPDGGCAGCQVFLNGFVLELTGPVIQFQSESSGALESVSPANITVILSNPEEWQTYTVDYAVMGGTAINGEDYILGPNTLTFDPCVTSQQIAITIINDGEEEDDETIVVELSNATGGSVSLGTTTEHTYAILDPRTGVSFDATASSGLEDVSLVNIAVSLSAAMGETVTVNYAVTGGTAAGEGVDYQLLGDGSLEFNPGEMTKYIEIAIWDDSIEEAPDETIELTLSNPSSNVKLGLPNQHTYTILNNEEGIMWDGLRWYYSEYPNPLVVNEANHLVWYPEGEDQFMTRLPEQSFSQVGDMVEISYWWMTDGATDCDDCFRCEDDCYEESIECIDGTSDMRAGFFEADGEYITGDGFDTGSSVFEGYKGYGFRFGPNMKAGPVRWNECGEVMKTGNFQKKPVDLDNLLSTNDGLFDEELDDYIPGFELPAGDWSLWTISIERLSSSSVELSITLNDRTYTYTDTSSSEQPSKIDVFAFHMRNHRPYNILEWESLSPPPPPPPSGTPEAASNPSPADGANDVDPNVALTWIAGANTLWHDVYFGTDSGSVTNANIVSSEHKDRQDFDVNMYEPATLELGATYCWRIDEMSESDACKGQVWSFTVRDYIVVDDMESYEETSDLKSTWLAGEVGNGAYINLAEALAHSGEKSMKFDYHVAAGAYWSVRRPYSVGQDWTVRGVNHLALWFYGKPINNPGDEMYVTAKDGSGHSSTVTYDGDGNDVTEQEWHEWKVLLQDFNDGGVTLTDVREFVIGVDPVFYGTLYFDDIRSHTPRCIFELRPAADLDGDCAVNSKDLAILGSQWKQAPGVPSADIAEPFGIVDWKDLAVLVAGWLEIAPFS